MQITIMSVLSIIFYCMVFSIILTIILENVTLLRKIKCEVILACMAVIVLKMLMPMEIIPWTINVNVGNFLPEATVYLCKREYVWGDILYSRWDVIVVTITTLSVLNMIRVLLLYLNAVHKMNKLPDCEDTRVQNMVDGIVKEYQKNVRIPVKRYSRISAPSIIGMKKVVILMPTGDIKMEGMEGILRHEVAHYMHGDMIIRFIWMLVMALNWWNPVVYILNTQLVKLLEIRADEKATQKMNGKEVSAYGLVLIEYAKQAGKKKKLKRGISLLGSGNWLIRKRVEVLSKKYLRTKRDVIINYVCMVVAIAFMLFVMNVFIFEPKGEAPLDDYTRTREVTSDGYFWIINADGKYDMYVDGVYCATFDSTLGSDIKVYDSLEEALKYEEIK